MKQLKFMLAAATAIGLATVAQADANAQLAASTGFEELLVTPEGGAVQKGTDNYFYYGGDASDNESKIIEAAAPSGMDRRPYGTGYFTGDKLGQAKVLEVNTGTNPVLRALAPVVSEPASLALTADTYVDTLVKFTVTPGTDDVENTTEDKLMVYLKEMTNGVGAVTGTNLVVKAGYLGWNEEGPAFSVKEYATSTVEVEPNQWYRLTVKVLKNVANSEYGYKIQAFTVSINGTELGFASSFDTEVNDIAGILDMEAYGEDLEAGMLLSIKAGAESETSDLKAVGFAGEGYVDDFIVTTDDPSTPIQTSIDFTLTLGDNVSSVQWTVDGVPQTMLSVANEKTSVTALNVAGKAIAITGVEYAAGYAGAEDWANWSIAANVLTESTNVVVTATQFATVENGVVKPTEATIAAAAGGDFACNATDAAVYAEEVAKLGKAVKWASTVAKKSYADAMAFINEMDFDDEVTTNNVPEAAYLLNCEPTAAAVKEAFENFSFNSADLAALIAFEADTTTDAPVFAVESYRNLYNGKLTIKGAKSLGAWFDVEDGKIASGVDGAKEVPNFLKAVLTK